MGIPRRLYIKEVYGCSQCPSHKFRPEEGGEGNHICITTGKRIPVPDGLNISELETFPNFCPLRECE